MPAANRSDGAGFGICFHTEAKCAKWFLQDLIDVSENLHQVFLSVERALTRLQRLLSVSAVFCFAVNIANQFEQAGGKSFACIDCVL